MTSVDQEKPVDQADLDVTSPPLTLRILMVLQSDFDKPTKVSKGKTYEKTISFEMEAKEMSALKEHLPGFIENSFYDKKKKVFQVNCWVGPS
jgi:hypothetical protein